MELFLNPWYMVAGGALVSAPILIHLINRMRFKRIRWAAMEFLLKSQKRNRRRLIIEQMILLLLRILLVLLAAFLVARFVGANFNRSSGATHVIFLDDTPSMGDRWTADGKEARSFDVARELVRELARAAASAPSAQYLQLRLFSEPNTALFDQRLNDRTLDELATKLAQLKLASVHVDPIVAVQKGQEILNGVQVGQKVLHIVSDFRDADWVTGPDVNKLNEAIAGLQGDRINLSLIDAAVPARSRSGQQARFPDNLAVVDFHAETPVAPEGVPVTFKLRLRNYSEAPSSPRFLKVKVNGQEDYGPAQNIDPVEARSEKEIEFPLTFTKTKAGGAGTGTSLEDRERARRLDREFFHITAEITPGDGLSIDNVRDLVVEVRKKVPILVVDDGTQQSRGEKGDVYYLETAIRAAGGFEIELQKVDELGKLNLDLYPSIIFVNVPEIKDTKVVEKLEDYAVKGGSVAYFLGGKAQPRFYNNLCKKYQGLFPLTVAEQPTDPVDPNGTLTADEREERRRDRRINDAQPKLLVRLRDHDLAKGLSQDRGTFRFLSIDRYYRARPRGEWDSVPPQAEEVVLLPNTSSIDIYKNRAQDLARQAVEATRELAGAEAAYQKFVPAVERFQTAIRTALAPPGYLFNLVQALDALLNDSGGPAEANRPDMPTLWAHPKMKALAAQIKDFRETVEYGDPLVVSRPHGKGRVVAVLTGTDINSGWTNWPDGSLGSWSFAVFVKDLETHLLKRAADLNRTVGEDVRLTLDANRYQAKVRRKFRPQPEPTEKADGDKKKETPPEEDLGEQTLPIRDKVLEFEFTDARRPGVYTFEFSQTAVGTAVAATEVHSFAFNLDPRESNLERAVKDRLEASRNTRDSRAGTVTLQVPGDSFEAYRERQSDASESPWLYLFFILVLIAEQALAVHLSFHLKGSEGVAPTPAPARAARAEQEPVGAA